MPSVTAHDFLSFEFIFACCCRVFSPFFRFSYWFFDFVLLNFWLPFPSLLLFDFDFAFLLLKRKLSMSKLEIRMAFGMRTVDYPVRRERANGNIINQARTCCWKRHNWDVRSRVSRLRRTSGWPITLFRCCDFGNESGFLFTSLSLTTNHQQPAFVYLSILNISRVSVNSVCRCVVTAHHASRLFSFIVRSFGILPIPTDNNRTTYRRKKPYAIP